MKKIALVTGVAGGIGCAVAEKLQKEGMTVIGLDIAETPPMPQNEDFVYVKGDLSRKCDRDRFVKKALSHHGRIDCLVNVAGVAPRERADLLEMREESYDFVMNVNTKGTLFLTQSVARAMIAQGGTGSIVNISSMSAYTASVNRGEYCISKAGVSMITALFAARLAEYGIAVNEIRPGIIKTDMTSTVSEKYDTLIADGLLPISRWGMPQDVADAVYALVGNSLPYVTGQSIDVDGGFHIRRL